MWMISASALVAVASWGLSLLGAEALSARKVVVTGASGRLGRLVVSELEAADVAVTAVVRDPEKAATVLPASVAVVTCDLAGATVEATLAETCAGCDGVIWCATGFGADGTTSVDLVGLKALRAATEAMVVMLSSAGVSRPAWPAAKKDRLVGAADIPIIRLNPGGILDLKREAEQLLRDSPRPYAIVRPTGLKDEWPQGRPIFSQGDVAVGRSNPNDVAAVCVAALDSAEAQRKTFEMFTLAGYPRARSLGAQFATLQDDAVPIAEAAVEANYALLQQLLPGEEQDATKLEMGRSYEQVDRGDVAARTRGTAPTDRERALAAGVAGAKKQRSWLHRLFKAAD